MMRRPAITLIEALVAIFVMAIGLLALLTLFPLGAVQMAHVLKDDRTAQAASIGVAEFKAFDLPNDGLVNSVRFENPWPGSLFALHSGFVPSYPEYVDPIGCANMQPAPPPIGGIALGVPRVTVSRVPQALGSPQWQYRWFTLQDDLTFADDGAPDPNIGIQREGRYTWAYLVRRQAASVPAPPTVPGTPQVPPIDLTVVVYSGRSPGLDFNGVPLGETAYPNTTFVTSTLVSINYAGQNRPPVRRGSWVFDARMLTIPGQRPNATTGNVPQGYFYRVVSVNDVAAGVVDVEVQRPLGGPMRGGFGIIPGSNPQQTYPPGPLVVMENVSEVFEKATDY